VSAPEAKMCPDNAKSVSDIPRGFMLTGSRRQAPLRMWTLKGLRFSDEGVDVVNVHEAGRRWRNLQLTRLREPARGRKDDASEVPLYGT
jgi:hypothetical protein